MGGGVKMKIKRIKKDYHSKEEMPEELRKDFYNASVHLSACWMLMSIIMQHLDSALTKKSNEQQKFVELTK